MIVGERLEKVDRLRLVIVAPSCWLGLTRPKDGGVLRMALFKRIPVLCVPRIVECPHELKIVLCHVILPKYAVRLLKQVLAHQPSSQTVHENAALLGTSRPHR